MTASVACLMLGNWAIATCEGIIGARRIVTIRRLDVTYEITNGEFVRLTLCNNAESAFRTNEQLCYIKTS
jgi:hypothetical protein